MEGWLELRPNVWTIFRDLNNVKNSENLEKAINAKTNIECFNDWVKELKNIIIFIIIQECGCKHLDLC